MNAIRRPKEPLRRLTDILVSSVALIVSLPVMLLIAVTAFFSSGTPVFYAQARTGANGRVFKIWKFRTMKRGSEPYGPELSHPDDPRVTGLGRILRKFHLDELPQFWNILRGDMTLVSYRPERPFYVAKILQICPEYGELLSYRPGLVSAGVLDYGYASTIDALVERAALDLEYLRKRNGASDVRQIWKTFRNVIEGRGT